MKSNFRQKLVVAVTFLSGLYFFLEFLLPEKIGTFKFGAHHEAILQGVTVVGTMAFGLGLINILRVHGGRVVYGQKGWINSFALLAGMILMFIVQGGEFVASQDTLHTWKPLADLSLYFTHIDKDFAKTPGPAANMSALAAKTLNGPGESLVQAGELLEQEGNEKGKRARAAYQLQLNIVKEKVEQLRAAYADRASKNDESDAGVAATHALTADLNASIGKLISPAKELAQLSFEARPIEKASSLLYNGFFVPLGAAMFALLAFYIATAAYRSFRLKSVEAAAMMTTAVAVILGQISYGRIYISENLPQLRFWLMQNINTPGNRAIYFGAAIGGFAMAVRMWLSLEKNPLELDDGAGK